MTINIIMSNKVESYIFNSINNYFLKYIKEDKIIISEKAIEKAEVYHYHRPNLEKQLNKNSIVTVHHDLEDTDPWLDINNYLDRYREAETIVCLNSNQMNILKENGITNTVLIPHGVNKEVFKEKQKKINLNDKKTIGIISKRYVRRVKGEIKLIEYLKRLDNTKINFIFVGNERRNEYEIAKKYGFESKLIEYLPYELYGELYEEIDFLMINSLFEGGPGNLPEAIYSRTPIISRPIAMVSDYLEENINGIKLTDNIDKDVEKINEIIKEENYKKLIKEINKYEIKILSWQEVIDKYKEIYRKIGK